MGVIQIQMCPVAAGRLGFWLCDPLKDRWSWQCRQKPPRRLLTARNRKPRGSGNKVTDYLILKNTFEWREPRAASCGHCRGFISA